MQIRPKRRMSLPRGNGFHLDTFTLQPFGVPATFDWHVLAFGILLLVACLFHRDAVLDFQAPLFQPLADSWFSLGCDAMFPSHLSVPSEGYEASLNRKNCQSLPARPLGAAVVFLNDRD
jgi:hypothetical protein